MGTHQWPPDQADTSPETRRLLTAADYLLRERNFSYCHNCALRARNSDPTHPGPIAILAVATVLSAPTISPTRRDYYAVFSVPCFEFDATQIRNRFRTLTTNLNPSVNPYSFAAEALQLVLTAWSVLSNPEERARFDEELRTNLSSSDGGVGSSSRDCMLQKDADTFWTICPFCYHVYEFERAYEDCCVRCSNEKCERVLHAVAIRGPPPSPDVVEKGQYFCTGFLPLGISGGGGEQMEMKLWSPFEPLVGSASKMGNQNTAGNGEGAVIDVSVDYVMARTEGVGAVRSEIQDLSPVERTTFKAGASENGKLKPVNGERLVTVNGIGCVEESSVKEERTRRKESAPWSSKKLMGRGVEIDENQANPIYGFGESRDSNMTEDSEEGLELGIGGEMNNGIEIKSGVEFFEGDDDVMISLQCDS